MSFPLFVAVLSFYHDLQSFEKCLPFILQTVPLVWVYYILVRIGIIHGFARDAIIEYTGLSNKHVLSPAPRQMSDAEVTLWEGFLSPGSPSHGPS